MEFNIKIKDTATLERLDELGDYLNHMKTYHRGSEHLELERGHFADVIETIELVKS